MSLLNQRHILSTYIIILDICVCLNCHTINDTNRLLKEKLTDYNRGTRPTINQSEPTVVNFNFDLTYIKEFDEVKQTLEIIGTSHLQWVDELMKWNPQDYGGMYTVLTESGPFWTPNLVLMNNADKLEKIGDSWQTIRYAADGKAYYYPLVLLTSTCSADVSLYPWDIHYCFLTLIPQGYFPDEMYLNASGTKFITSYYIDNGAWKFIDSNIKPHYSEFFTYIDLQLVFERKPLYAVVNILIPVLFMAILNILVFLIPVESGERISYSITVLLAIAVFLTIVGDTLPKSSTPMSYFSYFLMAMLSESILITMCTILNLRVYFINDSEPVTGCWAKLVVCLRNCGVRKSRGHAERKYTGETLNKEHRNETSNTENTFLKSPDSGKHQKAQGFYNVETNGSQRNTRDSQEQKKGLVASNCITWKSVSQALDKLFFVFFLTLIVVESTLFVVIISTSERNIRPNQ